MLMRLHSLWIRRSARNTLDIDNKDGRRILNLYVFAKGRFLPSILDLLINIDHIGETENTQTLNHCLHKRIVGFRKEIVQILLLFPNSGYLLLNFFYLAFSISFDGVNLMVEFIHFR